MDDDRKAALDRWSLHVFNQLQAGYPAEAIREQFSHMEDATPEDVAVVLARGKERYAAFWKFHSEELRKSAREFCFGGLVVITISIPFMEYMGWPEHGRGRFLIFIAMGLGLVAKGLHIFVFESKPSGGRTDLHKL